MLPENKPKWEKAMKPHREALVQHTRFVLRTVTMQVGSMRYIELHSWVFVWIVCRVSTVGASQEHAW